MLWFLRLFPAYRALLAERNTFYTRNAGLLSRLDEVKRECDQMIAKRDERIKELTSELVTNIQKSADFVAKMKYGRTIFGDMPDVAVDLQNQKPIEHPRPQAFDLVKEAERQFRESLKPKPAQN